MLVNICIDIHSVTQLIIKGLKTIELGFKDKNHTIVI
jgi:hypothetical protein